MEHFESYPRVSAAGEWGWRGGVWWLVRGCISARDLQQEEGLGGRGKVRTKSNACSEEHFSVKVFKFSFHQLKMRLLQTQCAILAFLEIR